MLRVDGGPVRFLERTVTVDRQLVTLARQAPCLGPPKTRASNRTIPLPQVVVDALAAHLAEFPADPDGLLFTLVGEADHPVGVRAQVAGSGGDGGASGRDRLSCASPLLREPVIRHGESVKTVQARLGHASAVETLDTYSHLWPDSDDRTRDAIDSVLGSTADPLRTEAMPNG